MRIFIGKQCLRLGWFFIWLSAWIRDYGVTMDLNYTKIKITEEADNGGDN